MALTQYHPSVMKRASIMGAPFACVAGAPADITALVWCSLSADKEEQRATVQESSVMEAWDASLPTLWASLSHMSQNAAAVVPESLCWSTHQSQESDARTGEGSNVQVIGYPVLKGENTEVNVFLFE